MPSVDITAQLINRTIFVEYLYPGWRGHWLAPANNYRAAVWPVIEDRIFDPAEGLRLFIRDCEDGYVCLRTRWLEEKYSNYFLHSGNHYFKYSTFPAGNEKLKWKVYCSSVDSTEKCMICDTCMTNCVRRNKYLNKNFVNTFLYWAVCKSIYIGGVK